jgi:hypothetical protein
VVVTEGLANTESPVVELKPVAGDQIYGVVPLLARKVREEPEQIVTLEPLAAPLTARAGAAVTVT